MYVLEDDQQTDKIETIHVYMIREDDPRPEPEGDKPQCWPNWLHIRLPAFSRDKVQQFVMASIAMFMLVGFAFAPTGGPLFVIKTLRIPLIALPVQTFMASVNITSTGVQQIPATTAHGTLTIYNGSILQELLPVGFIVNSAGGVEIATDQAVTIPPANPPAFGIASVPAHAVQAGAAGNVAAYSVSQADGVYITIKNINAFTGGQDASTRQYATAQDVNNAMVTARQKVEAQPVKGLLLQPCGETVSQAATSVSVTRSCQAYTYTLPKRLYILSIKIARDVVVISYRAFIQS